MRYSALFGKTLKQAPSEATAASHRLLVQAGYIRELAAGRYHLLPLGFRTRARLERIVAEELDRIGGQRLGTPSLHPVELWERTGRTGAWGPTLMRVEDRRGAQFALGATHEEVFTDLVKRLHLGYRDLPLILYQFSPKFRDEPRPRAGLLRVREFLMKDAYSFHADAASLDAVYAEIFDAYRRIYARWDLPVIPVEADNGAMGGSGSHEFVVEAVAGEDRIALCDGCGYAANVEVAEFRLETLDATPPGPAREVAAPGATTIEKMMALYDAPAWKCLKSVVFKAEGRLVGVAIRGDLDVNERKLCRALGVEEVEQASDEEVLRLGTVRGFISPVGLPGLRWLGDRSLPTVAGYYTGANRLDVDLADVQLGRDFTVEEVADLATAPEGAGCLRCDGRLRLTRAIEVAHLFKLGTRYSASLGAHYTAPGGEPGTRERVPFAMGCYGIGLERNLATIVERHHDARGIVWPASVAPFGVHLVLLGTGEAERCAADTLYIALAEAGANPLYDDRDESAGVKFADADLIGLPLRLVVSARTRREHAAEVKPRAETTARLVPLSEAATVAAEWLREAGR